MVVAPDTMQVGMLEGIAHRDPREALPRGEDQLAAGPPERTEQNSANASRGPDFLQTGESFRSGGVEMEVLDLVAEDRKSTRLNSSHVKISYAVFCLKK